MTCEQQTNKQKLTKVVLKLVFLNRGFEGATPMLSCTRCCRSRDAGAETKAACTDFDMSDPKQVDTN